LTINTVSLSHLVERLADLVSGSPTQTMLRYVEPKRSALLLCWLWRLRTQLISTQKKDLRDNDW